MNPFAAASDAPPARTLPRHFLQACLLLFIRGRPTYGYELRDRLLQVGLVQHDWGQLYRTLRGMEREGLVLSCWENSEAGPSRRRYHVTEKGSERLASWAAGMAEAQDLVEAFLSLYKSRVRREGTAKEEPA